MFNFLIKIFDYIILAYLTYGVIKLAIYAVRGPKHKWTEDFKDVSESGQGGRPRIRLSDNTGIGGLVFRFGISAICFITGLLLLTINIKTQDLTWTFWAIAGFSLILWLCGAFLLILGIRAIKARREIKSKGVTAYGVIKDYKWKNAWTGEEYYLSRMTKWEHFKIRWLHPTNYNCLVEFYMLINEKHVVIESMSISLFRKPIGTKVKITKYYDAIQVDYLNQESG